MLTNSILCIFNFSPRFETTTAANYKRNQSNKEAHDAKTKSSTESEERSEGESETSVVNKASERGREGEGERESLIEVHTYAVHT